MSAARTGVVKGGRISCRLGDHHGRRRRQQKLAKVARHAGRLAAGQQALAVWQVLSDRHCASQWRARLPHRRVPVRVLARMPADAPSLVHTACVHAPSWARQAPQQCGCIAWCCSLTRQACMRRTTCNVHAQRTRRMRSPALFGTRVRWRCGAASRMRQHYQQAASANAALVHARSAPVAWLMLRCARLQGLHGGLGRHHVLQ